jgi:riboflavin kinase / FMN adenylyltransferase
MAVQSIVFTIGVFDGIHLGHQALVRETVSLAKKMKARPQVLTFQDHPVHVLRGGPRIPFLLTRQANFELLKLKGAKEVHVLHFTKAFSRKTPEQFVQWLRAKGRLKGVVIGENFRFGKHAQGDVKVLTQLGKKYGFEVRAVKPVKLLGKVVSSSRIRESLALGKTELANRMLGRPYSIDGLVIHGKQVGRRIGFPTANLKIKEDLLPKDGVYACAVKLGSKFYRAGMNLGRRPTFKDDDHHRHAEVHLLHYYGRLYGEQMRVHLLNYVRPEKKFASPILLVAQIKKDLARIQKASLAGLKSL